MKRGVALAVVALAVVLAWWLWPEDARHDVTTETIIGPPLVTNPAPERRRGLTAALSEGRIDAPLTLAPRVVALEAPDASTAGFDSDDAGSRDAKVGVIEWLKQNAAAAEKNVEAFCEQAKAMKQAPPDPPAGRRRDASSFLTVRIDWEGNVRPPGLLHLPEPLRARLKQYGAAWPTAISDDDFAGLDFSWMTTIHEFDHWNLVAEGPLRESRDHDYYDAPIPNFIELQAWLKLRLARAMRVHDFEQTSADIHQLVALLRSTGLVIADMVAVALLNLERTGLEAAVAAGLAVPAGLAYSADETATERRVGRIGMYFMFPGVSEKTMKRAYACNTHFRCAMLAEALGAHVTLGGIQPAPTLELVSSLVGSSGCNAELMEWIRSAAQRSAPEALSALGQSDNIERVLAPPDSGR